VDDEPRTVEDGSAVQAAKDWLRHNGSEGIPHEEILKEFGLTQEDFRRMANDEEDEVDRASARRRAALRSRNGYADLEKSSALRVHRGRRCQTAERIRPPRSIVFGLASIACFFMTSAIPFESFPSGIGGKRTASPAAVPTGGC